MTDDRLTHRPAPAIPRRGTLRNGNPAGNPWQAPRCGAKTRRGTACGCPAMKNGRCRLHGGLSPGPPRGNRNAWKHGLRSTAAVAARKERVARSRQIMRDLAAWALVMRAEDGEPLTAAQQAVVTAFLERLDD